MGEHLDCCWAHTYVCGDEEWGEAGAGCVGG